ncbi:SRPBCC family protein [Flavobacterium sp.]
MRSNLAFDFIVNKENNTVNVTREFAANLELVWDAWTNPEILDQWWAPKPWKTETVSMDFSEGGRWLYYMQGPEGERHYCINDYKKIELRKSFSGLDAFSDDQGNINPEMPRTLWKNDFNQNGDTTTVSIVAQYESLEDLEKIISLGFKEGFTMALENLDTYFAALKQ